MLLLVMQGLGLLLAKGLLLMRRAPEAATGLRLLLDPGGTLLSFQSKAEAAAGQCAEAAAWPW